MPRRLFAAVLAVALGLAPEPRTATAEVAGLDAIAIVTDVALARIAQSVLPVHFSVDGTNATLDSVVLCPATSEHEVDLVGLATPDGAPPVALPLGACDTSLPVVAGAAIGASAASWRAAVRVHVAWSGDYALRGSVTDTAIALGAHAAPNVTKATSAPGLVPAPAPSVAAPPDAQRLRAALTATPLFSVDTRHLLDLQLSGKRFSLTAIPKFEAHRIVIELMRDEREAGDRAGWTALEADASTAVPPGSDAVVAGTHPFVGRTLAEAFASPVEVYRAQDHVITIHDVRETGTAGDVRASGEAVDTVSGASGTITGEYAGSSDLTLRRVDVVAHEHACSFVDLGCIANNLALRIGSGALARQILQRYGNSPLRPTQPIAFPVSLEGRNLVLSIDAIATRSTAASLRVAGRLGVSAR